MDMHLLSFTGAADPGVVMGDIVTGFLLGTGWALGTSFVAYLIGLLPVRRRVD